MKRVKHYKVTVETRTEFMETFTREMLELYIANLNEFKKNTNITIQEI